MAKILVVDDNDYTRLMLQGILVSEGHDVVNAKDGEELSVPAATLSYKDMSLNIYTSAPCIQLYTGNYLSNDDIGKGGCHYAPRSGVALETQFAPNSINTTSLIKPILNKNIRAHSATIYQFC